MFSFCPPLQAKCAYTELLLGCEWSHNLFSWFSYIMSMALGIRGWIAYKFTVETIGQHSISFFESNLFRFSPSYCFLFCYKSLSPLWRFLPVF